MQSKTWKTLAGVGAFVATLAGGAVMVPGAGASTGVQVSSPSRSTALPDVVGVPAVSSQGIVPPQNPSKSLPPAPNFSDDGSCKSNALDNSQTCNADVVKAVDNARTSLESMSALSLNLSAYEDMTVPQQLFAMTNLERTERGLAPIAGLTTQLDSVAQTGANDNSDPDMTSSTLTGGATVNSWGSIWAGGTSNALGSDYYWMYDDGPNSPNSACSTSNPAGCWGHRDVILGTFATCAQAEQYMGAGDTATGSSSSPSIAEIVVGACGSAPTDVVYTWAQAEKALGGGGGGTTVPTAPRDVKAVTAKKGVTLTWDAPANNGGAAITGYQIFRGHRSGAETPYTKVACTASTCTYTNKSARAKRMFFYTVAAMNSVGTGPASSEVSARAG